MIHLLNKQKKNTQAVLKDFTVHLISYFGVEFELCKENKILYYIIAAVRI